MADRPGRRALFNPAPTPQRKSPPRTLPPEPPSPPSPGAGSPPDDERPRRLARALEAVLEGEALPPLDAFEGDAVWSPVARLVSSVQANLDEVRTALADAQRDAAGLAAALGETATLREEVEALVERHPLPTVHTGPDLVIREANPAFVRMTGLAPAALIGRSVLQLPSVVRTGEDPSTAVKRGIRTSSELTMELPSGPRRLTEHAVPVSGPDGTVRTLYLVYEPLPAPQPGAEKPSVAYEQLFAAVMDEAPLPIALLDPSLRVVRHNHALEELLGFEEGALREVRLTALPFDGEAGGTLEAIAELGEEAFDEVRFRGSAGVRYLERYVLPIRDDAGALFRLLVVFTDQTIRREQEQRIDALEQQSQTFEAAIDQSAVLLADAIGRLAGGDLAFRLPIREGDPLMSVMEDYNRAAAAMEGRLTELERGTEAAKAEAAEARADAENERTRTAAMADRLGELENEAEAIRSERDEERSRAAAGIEATADEDAGALPTMIALESASEIAQLLLAALAGDLSLRLPVAEEDPLGPLRAEINEALDAYADEQAEFDAIPGAVEEPATLADEAETFESAAGREDEPPAPTDDPVEAMPMTADAENTPLPEPAETPAPALAPSPAIPGPSPPLPPIEDEPIMTSESITPQAPVQALSTMIDIVTFEMGHQQYALDIHLAREIVEMIPITPIPRAPSHITGIINLRGEITTILNLYQLMGLPEPESTDGQKIVVLVPEAAEGSNVGIIVDNVHSVNQIPVSRVELNGDGASADYTGFVRGIIKMKEESEGDGSGLVIWVDMPKILQRLVA